MKQLFVCVFVVLFGITIGKKCKTGDFDCGHNKCIPMTFKCDGEDDCLGGVDEVDCLEIKKSIVDDHSLNEEAPTFPLEFGEPVAIEPNNGLNGHGVVPDKEEEERVNHNNRRISNGPPRTRISNGLPRTRLETRITGSKQNRRIGTKIYNNNNGDNFPIDFSDIFEDNLTGGIDSFGPFSDDKTTTTPYPIEMTTYQGFPTIMFHNKPSISEPSSTSTLASEIYLNSSSNNNISPKSVQPNNTDDHFVRNNETSSGISSFILSTNIHYNTILIVLTLITIINT